MRRRLRSCRMIALTWPVNNPAAGRRVSLALAFRAGNPGPGPFGRAAIPMPRTPEYDMRSGRLLMEVWDD